MDAFLEEQALDEQRVIKCAPYPKRWKTFARKHALTWAYIEFAKAKVLTVPDKPGVYCFFIGVPPTALPTVGYPLYAGESSQLRKRFTSYFSEMNSARGRRTVRKFLKVFWGEILFACATVPSHIGMNKNKRRTLERELNDALMPYYSHKDFSASVKAKRSAW